MRMPRPVSAMAAAGARRRAARQVAALEADRGLPGDLLLTVADVSTTRGISIPVAPTAVWPWIAQIGQRRGGFYSYDALENVFGCDIHSADEIVPAWQTPAEGSEVHLAPRVSLVVASVTPGETLVLRGGVPVGAASAPFDFTWCFAVLPETDGSTTRLVVRERYCYLRPWARLIVRPATVISGVMSRKMLSGIRDRALVSASAIGATR